MKDYYKTLEVRDDASPEVIEKAYKALLVKYHPDKQDASKREWAHKKVHELSQAFSVLSDPRQRRDYDLEMSRHLARVFWEEGLIGLTKYWMKR